jgi:hypothetical protein
MKAFSIFIFLPFILLCADPLDGYRDFLEKGTYEGQDWSTLPHLPKSRYDTFRFVFEYLHEIEGKVVVELGTSRSFRHGGLPGCNSDDVSYWNLANPENWDWGAGFFTRMAAIALSDLFLQIHTVDIVPSHIERCKIMTQDVSRMISYHVKNSIDFLKEYDASKKIDLLYLDTGDMTPIEPTALLQLEEVKIVIERDLISEKGLILIDDVKNRTPRSFGDLSDLGKSKHSIPYLISNGFEIIIDEYQVVLSKCK